MTVRSPRALAAGAGVLALLALVALAASRGGPVSSDAKSRSLSGGFLDVLFTLGVLGMLLTVVLIVFSMRVRRGDEEEVDLRALLLTALAVVAFFLLVALGAYLLASDEPKRASPPRLGATGPGSVTGPAGAQPATQEFHGRDAHVSWPTVVVGVAALLVIVAATWGRLVWSRRRVRRREERAVDEVRTVLQEALHDLEGADPRAAVIAAYARMERTLAVHGLPRRSSEAPFEYMRRALTELHASASSARELTELFELAKFSEHEIGEDHRTAAVRALEAMRQELAA